jgi:hypothetical protein
MKHLVQGFWTITEFLYYSKRWWSKISGLNSEPMFIEKVVSRYLLERARKFNKIYNKEVQSFLRSLVWSRTSMVQNFWTIDRQNCCLYANANVPDFLDFTPNFCLTQNPTSRFSGGYLVDLHRCSVWTKNIVSRFSRTSTNSSQNFWNDNNKIIWTT